MRREGTREHAEYAEAGPGAIAASALRYHKTARRSASRYPQWSDALTPGSQRDLENEPKRFIIDPNRRRLWPPAAATSSARLADGWPRTSARSPVASGAAASSAAASTVVGARTAWPRRCATASASVSTPKTGGPPASAASGALTAGTMRP